MKFGGSTVPRNASELKNGSAACWAGQREVLSAKAIARWLHPAGQAGETEIK